MFVFFAAFAIAFVHFAPDPRFAEYAREAYIEQCKAHWLSALRVAAISGASAFALVSIGIFLADHAGVGERKPRNRQR